MEDSTTKPKLDILFDAERIARRVRELGAQISSDYQGQPLRLVGILKGAWMFLADLARAMTLEELTIDFLGVSSYHDSAHNSGEVMITKDLDLSIEGLDVLLVEDILDTGETLHYLMGVLQAHKPRSVKVVALLDKVSRRTRPAQADYTGFQIPDEFVVGYGLDYAQNYRQLPDVRFLRNVPPE
ncbi:MAG: hypoxanthine phosphoribosyltransferase [Terriglobia bacterium]